MILTTKKLKFVWFFFYLFNFFQKYFISKTDYAPTPSVVPKWFSSIPHTHHCHSAITKANIFKSTEMTMRDVFARHISSQILFSSSTVIYTWFINLQNDAWQILREVERKFMFYSEKRTGIRGIRKTNKNFPWQIFLLCCLSLCRIKIEKESKEIRIEN